MQIIRKSMKYFAVKFIRTELSHCTDIVIFCAPENKLSPGNKKDWIEKTLSKFSV